MKITFIKGEFFRGAALGIRRKILKPGQENVLLIS
jgi:hypothetical protein